MNIADLLTSGLFRGVVIQYAPDIIKGAMKQYLHQVKFNDMVQTVKTNGSLWQLLPAQYRQALIKMGPKLGSLDWLTLEWVIQAAAESAPALASLFIGWPEGQEWLKRQVEDIKINVKGVQVVKQ